MISSGSVVSVNAVNPRLFRKFPFGAGFEVFVNVQKTAGQRPHALEWLDISLNQKDFKGIALDREYHDKWFDLPDVPS